MRNINALLVFNDINVLKFSITTDTTNDTKCKYIIITFKYSRIILHANAFAHQTNSMRNEIIHV